MGQWDEYFRRALNRYEEAQRRRRQGRKSRGKRKPLGKKLKDRVFSFYGSECIIGPDQPGAAVDLGHINEDHNDDAFPNLAPLCSSANVALARDDYKSQPDLRGQVDPDYIRVRAREHSRDGQYPQAYACNSVAAYLYESRRRDLTSAVESLVFAIAALRPLGDPELLLDTIAHCVAIFNYRSVGAFLKAEVLSQVGVVLYDFCAAKESLECEIRARELYRSAGISDHPEKQEERSARALKREALTYCPSLNMSRRNYVFDSLKEAKKAAETIHDREAFLSASWVEATLKSYLGHRPQSLDIVNECLPMKNKADMYTQVGLHVEAARNLENFGNRDLAIEHYAAATKLCQSKRIIPIPLPSDGGLIVFDPGSHLISLGRDDLGRIHPRGPNPLTPNVLKALLYAINRN